MDWQGPPRGLPSVAMFTIGSPAANGSGSHEQKIKQQDEQVRLVKRAGCTVQPVCGAARGPGAGGRPVGGSAPGERALPACVAEPLSGGTSLVRGEAGCPADRVLLRPRRAPCRCCGRDGPCVCLFVCARTRARARAFL